MLSLKIKKLGTNELIHLYSETIKELKSREIVRTKNIVGELGEWHCQERLELQLSAPNQKHFDALDSEKNRYSIKAVTESSAKRTSAIHLSEDIDINSICFEYLIVVILSDSMELESIHSYSWNKFWKLKSKNKNHYYLALTKSNLGLGKELYKKEAP